MQNLIIHPLADLATDIAITCRDGCGACCIAPAISSPMPGMPHGKPAGVPCLHLDAEYRCGIFTHPLRPKVCASLQPRRSMCGDDRNFALEYLTELEQLTTPKP